MYCLFPFVDLNLPLLEENGNRNPQKAALHAATMHVNTPGKTNLVRRRRREQKSGIVKSKKHLFSQRILVMLRKRMCSVNSSLRNLLQCVMNYDFDSTAEFLIFNGVIARNYARDSADSVRKELCNSMMIVCTHICW